MHASSIFCSSKKCFWCTLLISYVFANPGNPGSAHILLLLTYNYYKDCLLFLRCNTNQFFKIRKKAKLTLHDIWTTMKVSHKIFRQSRLESVATAWGFVLHHQSTSSNISLITENLNHAKLKETNQVLSHSF